MKFPRDVAVTRVTVLVSLPNTTERSKVTCCVIPALQKWRQEDLKFRSILGCKASQGYVRCSLDKEIPSEILYGENLN